MAGYYQEKFIPIGPGCRPCNFYCDCCQIMCSRCVSGIEGFYYPRDSSQPSPSQAHFFVCESCFRDSEEYIYQSGCQGCKDREMEFQIKETIESLKSLEDHFPYELICEISKYLMPYGLNEYLKLYLKHEWFHVFGRVAPTERTSCSRKSE